MVLPRSGSPYPPPTLSQLLTWPAAIAISPLLVLQGKAVRRAVPRLPHAPEPWDGSVAGPEPLKVLGIGDSTIAGVGVDDALHGLTAQFSLALSQHSGRGVSWRSVGHSGATTGDILRDFLPEATREPADVVLVSLGANDAKDLKPLGATIRRFDRLLDVIETAHPGAAMLFSSLPAFHLFPTLPQPLRAIMYGHAQAIERSVRPRVESRQRSVMSPPPPKYSDTFFAVDGFHPSVDGYRDWARFALEDALQRGALEHLLRR